MNWIQLAVLSPLTELVISPAKGARPEQVGVTRMRAVRNSSTRRRFMRWKRSKTFSSCSAVVVLGRVDEVAQDGIDLAPSADGP